MRRSAAALLYGVIVTASGGCGYRIVRRTDVTARRFAADSATMISLSHQIDTLRARCRADSLRMATERAAMLSSTAPAVTPTGASDSALKARDAEIASLRDLLARANAELDRIKRRLANPRS